MSRASVLAIMKAIQREFFQKYRGPWYTLRAVEQQETHRADPHGPISAYEHWQRKPIKRRTM
jgi:hypothetical protein